MTNLYDASEDAQDTKIVGRIDTTWKGCGVSTSTPVFENDTHSFNANGIKKHMLDLAKPSLTDEALYRYQLYTSKGLMECDLKELLEATFNTSFTWVRG